MKKCLTGEPRGKVPTGTPCIFRETRREAKPNKLGIIAISAMASTQAAKVMRLVSRLTGISPAVDVRAGLYLDSVRGTTFSLNCREEGNVLILSIGERLPESRVKHVAQSIAAMIARGSNWQDKSGHQHDKPWGHPVALDLEEPVIRTDPGKPGPYRQEWRKRPGYKAESLA